MGHLLRVMLSGLLLLASAIGQQAFATTEAEQKAMWDAVNAASIGGPEDVTLKEQATLHVPEDMFFVPRKESVELMRSWGNTVGDGFFGLVMSKQEGQDWVITIDQTAEGFVKDEDAKNWNADELLQSLKDGTEAANQERLDQGMQALDVIGWIQTPKYDASAHRLAWSMKAVHRGAAPDDPGVVNFNTYALGRDGYFELNLLTNEKSVEADKAAALKLVSAVEYKAGKKYSDFVEGTDHVAEYGLAALVAGVAAKKLGLLALGGLFFAKFAKLILVGLVVAGGGVARLFGRKKNGKDDSTPA